MESQDSTHSVMSWQQDLPDELPSWDFSEDVLGGFEHFLDTATLSEADLIPGEVAYQAAQAEEGSALPAGPSILQTEVADQGEIEDPDSGPSSARLSSPDAKKQRQNRQAQARFRQRQRVCFCRLQSRSSSIAYKQFQPTAQHVALPAISWLRHQSRHKCLTLCLMLLLTVCRFEPRIWKLKLLLQLHSWKNCGQVKCSSRKGTPCLKLLQEPTSARMPQKPRW